MKILMLTSSFPKFKSDYTAKWILELSSELIKNGHETVVLAPHAKGFLASEEIRGVKIYRFRYAPERFEVLGYGNFLPHEHAKKIFRPYYYLRNLVLLFFFQIAMFYSLLKIARRENIDVIFSHWIFPCGFMGAIGAKLLGKRSVLNIYGTDLVFVKRFFLSNIGRFTLNSYDSVVAISEYTYKLALDMGVEDLSKMKIVPVGTYMPQSIDAGSICALRSKLGLCSEKVVFSMHRLIPLKGTEYIIQAAALVVKEYPNVKFIIGGEGPLKEKLQSLIIEHNLTDNVLLVGAIPENEVPVYYAMSNIYIMSSIVDEKGNTEGLGMPVIEAMSYGKPVVGFDVGGPKYTILDGQNGYSIPEKDYDMMADKILRLLNDPGLELKMGKNGYAIFSRNYPWDVILKQFVEIFDTQSRECNYPH